MNLPLFGLAPKTDWFPQATSVSSITLVSFAWSGASSLGSRSGRRPPRFSFSFDMTMLLIYRSSIGEALNIRVFGRFAVLLIEDPKELVLHSVHLDIASPVFVAAIEPNQWALEKSELTVVTESFFDVELIVVILG